MITSVTFTELYSIDSESSEKKILVSKCVFVVAELLFGHQTPCMLPRSISTASLAFWATQMGYVVHHAIGWVKMGSRRRLGYSDPILSISIYLYLDLSTPRTQEGSSFVSFAFSRGTVRSDEKLFHVFHAVFVLYPPQRVGPQPRASPKTTCHRLRKRWDENTPLQL